MVAELDVHAPADVVLTSSTSGISPTEVVSGGLSTPDRVVVAHPFDELLSELEPVTLTYQPSTPSPEADVATPKFEELLEERSGGKIKLEVVYGQALAPYDEAGVVPLIAVEIARPKFTFCTDPAEGPDDWEGRQRRVGSSATQSIAEGIGTFPVSMDFLETFEALQRNTIDCTVASSVVAYATGLVEVAHPINYPTERSWPTVFGAYLAGKTYSELPKTYQQVIFDSMAVAQSETFGDSFMTLDWMVDSSEEQGGSITPYGSETDEALTGSADEVLAEIGSSGALEPEIVEGLDESFTRWESIVGELGFSDEESFEDVPDYYDESLDYTDFAAQLYEETALAHRPS